MPLHPALCGETGLQFLHSPPLTALLPPPGSPVGGWGRSGVRYGWKNDVARKYIYIYILLAICLHKSTHTIFYPLNNLTFFSQIPSFHLIFFPTWIQAGARSSEARVWARVSSVKLWRRLLSSSTFLMAASLLRSYSSERSRVASDGIMGYMVNRKVYCSAHIILENEYCTALYEKKWMKENGVLVPG